MKKAILLILSAATFAANSSAQNVTIPDANFKAYLINNTAININADTNIQVSEAAAFTGNIICSGQGITDMTGIEAFTALDKLDCRNNSLTTLSVDSNVALTELYCQNNSLTSLSVGNASNLNYIYCSNNSLTSLDVTNNPNLARLDFQTNLLTSIDLSNNPLLDRIYCINNNLSALDVSNNPNLLFIYAGSNNLTSLDVTANTSLGTLDCNNNSITSLDLSNVTNGFNQLICSYNNISTLILPTPSVTSFWNLTCYGNELTSLDISANTSVQQLVCRDNQFTSLNVANGNNSNFTTFDATSNPSLTCIQVDTVAYSVANWTSIDSIASFSVNCSGCAINNSIILQGTTLTAAQSGVDYQWINCSGNTLVSGATSQSFTPTATGSYACILTDTNCIDTSACKSVTIAIDGMEASIKHGLKVYPNPTSGMLNISSNDNIISLHVIDMMGKTHHSMAANATQIDVSGLTDGVYLLQVVTSVGLEQIRFIKQ